MYGNTLNSTQSFRPQKVNESKQPKAVVPSTDAGARAEQRHIVLGLHAAVGMGTGSILWREVKFQGRILPLILPNITSFSVHQCPSCAAHLAYPQAGYAFRSYSCNKAFVYVILASVDWYLKHLPNKVYYNLYCRLRTCTACISSCLIHRSRRPRRHPVADLSVEHEPI